MDIHLFTPLQHRFARDNGIEDLRFRLRELREAAINSADVTPPDDIAPMRAFGLVATSSSVPEIYRVRSGIPSILDDTPPLSDSAVDGAVVTAIFVAPQAPASEAVVVDHRLSVL